MGAAESSTLAPARSALEGPELDALRQRYGGGAADEPDEPEEQDDGYDPEDDGYDPCKPEYVAPADDYDPRKPEYILQANEDYEDRAVVQLKQQIQRLQAVLAKRRLDPTSNVVRHYERVLCDLQLAVDAAMQKRSSIARLQDGGFLSACSAYVAERVVSFGNDFKVVLANEMFASALGSNAELSPKHCLEVAPRPSPSSPCPLHELAGDLPASFSEEERTSKENGAKVQYALVPGGPLVCQSRIIETRVLPAKLFCTITIIHPPVPAAATGSSCSRSS